MLTRANLRHIVMLAQSTEVFVELLNLLLVRLDTLSFHLLLEPLAPPLFVASLGICLRASAGCPERSFSGRGGQ